MSVLSIVIPLFLGTLVLVSLAVGVIYALAISRRTPEDWQQHVKDHRDSFVETPLGPPLDAVEPQTVSLSGMLNARTEVGNAYYNPQAIPGFDRIEEATGRIEQRIAEQRSKEK